MNKKKKKNEEKKKKNNNRNTQMHGMMTKYNNMNMYNKMMN